MSEICTLATFQFCKQNCHCSRSTCTYHGIFCSENGLTAYDQANEYIRGDLFALSNIQLYL